MIRQMIEPFESNVVSGVHTLPVGMDLLYECSWEQTVLNFIKSSLKRQHEHYLF